VQMLQKFGIKEIARTGKVALSRESKVNTESLKL
jgi:acetolactate synthase I/III small subunit